MIKGKLNSNINYFVIMRNNLISKICIRVIDFMLFFWIHVCKLHLLCLVYAIRYSHHCDSYVEIRWSKRSTIPMWLLQSVTAWRLTTVSTGNSVSLWKY